MSRLPIIGMTVCTRQIGLHVFHISGDKSLRAQPLHYSGPSSEADTVHDPERDRTTLPLIRAAVAAGVPVLRSCRGFEEMNGAFGGTLHQQAPYLAIFQAFGDACRERATQHDADASKSA
ncbi:gamma-glutamyl-gamma-aminobutyrate hydrolase family protein [Pseudomonas akapageensis]|uniref:gamma-glutamyl-gamma-aminobutyrate hydrolase family protein n=1 Tax=Pseudomonas akapageensis TaxID=2609961 RepID=UPI00140B0E22|nr:gamma-glutamyl-gamma-aminobutyrate hydrolase family protein [Pseudomonas akapageensis]